MSDVSLDELLGRLGEQGLVVLDVRTPEEFSGEAGYPSDPRQGHLPGAVNVPLQVLFGVDPSGVRTLVGAPAGAEVIAYCHAGGRSAMAVELLRAAGYEARNYPGSWQEWAADPSLPVASA